MNSEDACNIRVVCRVRPLNSAETHAGSEFIPKFPNEGQIVLSGKSFSFDHVLNSSTNQQSMYDIAAKPIVKDVLAGYNGTIFAYGQTSSGKTHTMEGVIGDPEWQGIIPRIIGDIFAYIYTMDENLEFHIKVSYFEIYMDKIRDLLDVTKTNLAVHEDKNRIPYVKNITERFVSSPEEVFEIIDEGKSNRHVAVTNMNEHSSRSHSIFLIHIKQENVETHKSVHGKLYLVDLAGSEKVSKTGAEGMVLDEAKNINKSLSALGNVISALSEATKSHVPYRDSKLTRILQESLGGNARTTIIICCSPSSINESETKTTLQFGARAKTIKNSVKVNEELPAEEWKRRYEKEREKSSRIKRVLENYELELKKWRDGENVPVNEQAGGKDEGKLTSNHSTSKINIADALGESERVQFDEERNRLYEQIDEKDDELNNRNTLIEQLRRQLEDKDEEFHLIKNESTRRQAQINALEDELQDSKDEVKEVLNALEELYVNFDEKSRQLEVKSQEYEKNLEELMGIKSKLSNMEENFEETKDTEKRYKRRVTESIKNLLQDMHEIGDVLQDEELKTAIAKDSEKVSDEELTLARLHFGKIKGELKILVSRNHTIESERAELEKKLNVSEANLSENQLLLTEACF
ncbi:uncharacterized protein TRIADDRAFT_54045 [Trichoplax adhaerens]|uniref:Kinesin-like protein n=1 Tax=Trichoplax adhaerens TaxID=10228 RepID=B3RQY5_TRIAD|nr:hypothetical protein TRIADDRAFT_54045 [Trichoplax adhaerens]EDV26785.1 hypothetical protein TRIADDRAFT_54045 [Trichoplax adhaerens]|eukprot:XP_002110781.1 hypothetical protein TRIADDRAFT_54045 [Trichoplax adhaerens]